jgi:anthranilate/para-aminobenzoate synthase component II
MPGRGRPRKEIADDETQAKRVYQRDYQEARKTKITELTADIKKCETELKKMKKQKSDLKKMALEKLDKKLVGIDYDPEQKGSMKKALAYKKQQVKGNKIS